MKPLRSFFELDRHELAIPHNFENCINPKHALVGVAGQKGVDLPPNDRSVGALHADNSETLVKVG